MKRHLFFVILAVFALLWVASYAAAAEGGCGNSEIILTPPKADVTILGDKTASKTDTAILPVSSTPAFSWTATGAVWYEFQMYTPAGWIWSKWYEASTICNGTTCTAYPGTFYRTGSFWWWVNTWSTDCGFQLQPGGNVQGFTVAP